MKTFLSENFQFLEVKFCIYLYRCVFVMGMLSDFAYHLYSLGSKVIPQRQKFHRVQCIFMFPKINNNKFITFTSFES